MRFQSGALTVGFAFEGPPHCEDGVHYERLLLCRHLRRLEKAPVKLGYGCTAHVDAAKVAEQMQERSGNGGLLGRREAREKWISGRSETPQQGSDGCLQCNCQIHWIVNYGLNSKRLLLQLMRKSIARRGHDGSSNTSQLPFIGPCIRRVAVKPRPDWVAHAHSDLYNAIQGATINPLSPQHRNELSRKATESTLQHTVLPFCSPWNRPCPTWRLCCGMIHCASTVPSLGQLQSCPFGTLGWPEFTLDLTPLVVPYAACCTIGVPLSGDRPLHQRKVSCRCRCRYW